jgi:hypothetical protein
MELDDCAFPLVKSIVCTSDPLVAFKVSLLWEKTCFLNKCKFITEDYFVHHMNITTNKSLTKWNYIQIPKGNEGTSLIKCGGS